jgi:hypothetical protein
MGFNDHRKHWFVELSATRADCESAFRGVFSKGGGRMGRKGKFVVGANEGGRIVAQYMGRAGLGAAAAMVSNAQARIADSAKGSGISLAIEDKSESGRLLCELWLSNWGSAFGSLGTADVGILRPYLQDARDQIARLDPTARVWSEARNS